MAGNALASLAAGAGRAAAGKIGAARKGGVFGVAQEAVKGQYAAEAQERAHGHTKAMVRDIHKRAGEGTRVNISVNRHGDHEIGYNKMMIGEKYRGKVEDQSIKEHFGKNPTRNAQGYRENQPDHVQNAKEALGIEHKPILEIEHKPRLQNVTGVATGERKTVDHGDAKSVEAHLGQEEGAYLASRAEKLKQDASAKPTTTKPRKPRTPGATTKKPKAPKPGTATPTASQTTVFTPGGGRKEIIRPSANGQTTVFTPGGGRKRIIR